MTEHSLDARPTHSRWNRALPPRLRIASGDTVHFECLDSSGAQVHPGMTVAEFLQIDRGRSTRSPVPCILRTPVPATFCKSISFRSLTRDGAGQAL